jgi:hypothetical protein
MQSVQLAVQIIARIILCQIRLVGSDRALMMQRSQKDCNRSSWPAGDREGVLFGNKEEEDEWRRARSHCVEFVGQLSDDFLLSTDHFGNRECTLTSTIITGCPKRPQLWPPLSERELSDVTSSWSSVSESQSLSMLNNDGEV